MTESGWFTGGGDPKRSMELLWGIAERPARGPKQRLRLARITDAAIKLADSDGLGAVSMRRVAEELGVAAMTLYTYVPSKAELIDVMVDTVLGEAARSADATGGWRTRLERVARENWALYHRHPWMLQIATSRPPMGPNLVAKYDLELRAIDGISLSDVEMDMVLTLVLGYVQGAARGSVEFAEVSRRTGMSDAQWWAAYAPLLAQVYDADAHPVGARVGAASGEEYQAAYAPDRTFEFGLTRLLDGIEVFVASRG